MAKKHTLQVLAAASAKLYAPWCMVFRVRRGVVSSISLWGHPRRKYVAELIDDAAESSEFTLPLQHCLKTSAGLAFRRPCYKKGGWEGALMALC